MFQSLNCMMFAVSTHSRLKAAGKKYGKPCQQSMCFNTQPPEGGWGVPVVKLHDVCCFNTQPPEGGWAKLSNIRRLASYVSTHSRLKAAGKLLLKSLGGYSVSTHSRLKAAGIVIQKRREKFEVSTHSRLKAAGNKMALEQFNEAVSTHSRLKAAGKCNINSPELQNVSTHSRLKAAGCCYVEYSKVEICFNTQPPEGGWPH